MMKNLDLPPYEAQAIGRSKEVRIQGAGVRFASAEDLIIHKIFAGRPRDIDDVRTVLLKNPGIDRKYIRSWLTAFDSAFNGKALLESFEELDREGRRFPGAVCARRGQISAISLSNRSTGTAG
jgi:predicted nucleotidyltransferase